MGRRGRAKEMERRGCSEVAAEKQQQWQSVEQAVPHSPVVDKNWEGHLGSELSQAQARPYIPGF